MGKLIQKLVRESPAVAYTVDFPIEACLSGNLDGNPGKGTIASEQILSV